jgi:hypothetical protein
LTQARQKKNEDEKNLKKGEARKKPPPVTVKLKPLRIKGKIRGGR